jgi:AraC family transcriptional regulator, transcriptional activator of pobA
MDKKKQAQLFFKHDELVADPTLGTPSPIPGFSININALHPDHNQFKRHFRSDFLTVILISKGEISFTINLKQYTANKNDLIIIAPNTIKQLVDIQPGTALSIINFTTDFISKIGLPQNKQDLLAYSTSQFSPVWHLQKKDASTVLTLARQLKQRTDSWAIHPFGQEMLQHTFYLFLFEMAGLSKKYAQQINKQHTRKENLLIQFISLVQEQFRTQRSVQEYAKQLNITPKYLTETVKEISGKNAGAIIDDHVLLEAKLYLDNPEYSIAQIADELNFSDQSIFGKFFKRLTGLSPKEYRQSM